MSLSSNKFLMEKYKLSEEELLKIMNKCIGYFLSEEELYRFIEEYYFMLEMMVNKRCQK